MDSATGTDMRAMDGREEGARGAHDEGRAAGTRRGWRGAVTLAMAVVTLAGCGAREPRGAGAAGDSVRTNETPVAAGSSGGGAAAGGQAVAPLAPGSSVDRRPVDVAPVEGRPLRVLFLGTSLTAGLGLPDAAQQAWPAEIGRLAAKAGAPIEVVNAGLSGETSAGALRRVNWLLRDTADVIVIETGGNDGLRGLPVADLERNIRGIIAQARAKQPTAALVLVPMEAPPNLGGTYAKAFHDVYVRIAAETGVPLTPFLLEGVAGVAGMNQADGIHPTEAGATKAARTVWPALERVFAARRAGKAAA